MKNLFKAKVLLAGLLALFCFYACNKGQGPGRDFDVTQTNLVADTAGFGAARIDTNLLNAWGIAAAPGGPIWVLANHKGGGVVSHNIGHAVRTPFTIPSLPPRSPAPPSAIL